MFPRVTREVLRRSRLFAVPRISPACSSINSLQPSHEFRNRRVFSVFSKSPEYSSDAPLMDLLKFEGLCSETLESLTDYFEEVVESDPKLSNADVAYSVSLTRISFDSTNLQLSLDLPRMAC
jgi:hypothetical protein